MNLLKKTKIKLLIIDLDYTLTNNQSDIVSKENKNAIIKAQELGVKVIIATGRNFEDAMPVVKNLKIEKYSNILICLNGAMIYNIKEKKIIETTSIPSEKIKRIIELDKKNKITKIFINKEGNFFYSKKSWLISLYCFIYKKKFVQKSEKEILKEKIMNLYFLTNKKKINLFQKKNINLFICPMYFYIWQITATNKGKAIKGKAMQKITEKWNIKMYETMIIADNMNDWELIKMAKYGIVMKNGNKKLKKIAYDITTNWKKNGVANAIKKYII